MLPSRAEILIGYFWVDSETGSLEEGVPFHFERNSHIAGDSL
jgi:hypothetical protein